jgi:two-component system, OmpR family, phosphate regulon sensor histidine kinase PhoR
MYQTENGQHYLRAEGFFAVARQKQTYLNLLYLLAAFPLGITYFIVLITGLSFGISTLIIWIGIPALLLTMILWEFFARMERFLVRNWLGVRVPYVKDPRLANLSWTRQLLARLRAPVTWTSLAYLFLEFPFGIFSFTLAVTLLSISLGLVFSWLVYLIDTAVYQHIGAYNSSLFFVPINGQIQPGAMGFFLLLFLLGIIATFASLHVLNGVAYAWEYVARFLLGTQPSAAQLAEARAIAVQEHAKAERSEQSRRELIVNVSHELRTPIASIRGHLESMQMGGEDVPSGQQSYLEIVQRETERLSDLVDDLLELARSDAGELHLSIAAIVAGDVVEEVYQTMAPLARRERQITMTRSIQPDLPPVLADRTRLLQVLLNLVRNAITYTPDGGIVSISLGVDEASGDHIELAVSDTGIGIPPEDLQRVFGRFYRTDDSRARSSGGFGLGLAIVRDLVDAMGGSISAESTVGEGSRFRLLLQVAPASSEATYAYDSEG